MMGQGSWADGASDGSKASSNESDISSETARNILSLLHVVSAPPHLLGYLAKLGCVSSGKLGIYVSREDF